MTESNNTSEDKKQEIKYAQLTEWEREQKRRIINNQWININNQWINIIQGTGP